MVNYSTLICVCIKINSLFTWFTEESLPLGTRYAAIFIRIDEVTQLVEEIFTFNKAKDLIPKDVQSSLVQFAVVIIVIMVEFPIQDGLQATALNCVGNLKRSNE